MNLLMKVLMKMISKYSFLKFVGFSDKVAL